MNEADLKKIVANHFNLTEENITLLEEQKSICIEGTQEQLTDIELFFQQIDGLKSSHKAKQTQYQIVSIGENEHHYIILNDYIFNFKNCNFKKQSTLTNINFRGFNFENCTFQEVLYCHNLTFHSLTFKSCTFNQTADFRNLPIKDKEDSEKNTHIKQGKIDFSECTFNNEAFFENIHFKPISNPNPFNNTTFNRKTEFKNIIFENETYFTNTKFNHNTFFNNIEFIHEFRLDHKFKNKYSRFNKTTFNKISASTNFFENKEIEFHNCTFKEKVDFSRRNFTDNISFNDSTFEDNAEFQACTFEKYTSFYGVTFKKAFNFSQTIFKETLILVNTNLEFDFENLKNTIKKKAEIDKSIVSKIANDFRDTFRGFKSILIENNNLLDASEFHKYELYCKEIELKQNKEEQKLDFKDKNSTTKNAKNFKLYIDYLLLGFYRNLYDHHTDFLKVFNNLILLIALYVLVIYMGNFDIPQNLAFNSEILYYKPSFLLLETLETSLGFIRIDFLIIVFLLALLIAIYLIIIFTKDTASLIWHNIKSSIFYILSLPIITLVIIFLAFLLNFSLPKDYSFSIATNLGMIFLFTCYYLWLIYLNNLFLRYCFIIISYGTVLIAIGFNIAYLSPLIGKLLDNNTQIEPLFASITFNYTILMALVLFSLQKTARKNSIVPN